MFIGNNLEQTVLGDSLGVAEQECCPTPEIESIILEALLND